MNSENLFQGCMNKDKDAWTYAFNFVCKFLKNKQTPHSDIQDIAQTTLLYFINRGLSCVEKPDRFKYLLLRNAWHNRINYYRRAFIHREMSWEIQKKDSDETYTHPAVRTTEPHLEKKLDTMHLLTLAHDLINSMKEKCRTVLKAYLKGKAADVPIQDIAASLETPPNTFSQQVSRCFRDLIKKPGYPALLKRFEKAIS